MHCTPINVCTCFAYESVLLIYKTLYFSVMEENLDNLYYW